MSLARQRLGGWGVGSGCRCGRRLRFSAGIDEVAQLFAGFEVRNLLGWDFDLCASLRIASDAWLALANAEAAEATNLDLVAGAEGSDDGIEDGLDNRLTVAARQVAQFSHFLDKVSFRHGGGGSDLG